MRPGGLQTLIRSFGNGKRQLTSDLALKWPSSKLSAIYNCRTVSEVTFLLVDPLIHVVKRLQIALAV